MLLKNRNKNYWFEVPEVSGHVTKASSIFRQAIEQRDCENITKFLLQFEGLDLLVTAYNAARYNGCEDSYQCICSLIQNEMTSQDRSKLINLTHKVGFNNVRQAFQILNQDCQCPLHESKDLFYYIKKHRLGEVEIKSDDELLVHLSYYLNVTLINLHRIKNLSIDPGEGDLKKRKGEASRTLTPIVAQVFNSLLNKKY